MLRYLSHVMLNVFVILLIMEPKNLKNKKCKCRIHNAQQRARLNARKRICVVSKYFIHFVNTLHVFCLLTSLGFPFPLDINSVQNKYRTKTPVAHKVNFVYIAVHVEPGIIKIFSCE